MPVYEFKIILFINYSYTFKIVKNIFLLLPRYIFTYISLHILLCTPKEVTPSLGTKKCEIRSDDRVSWRE